MFRHPDSEPIIMGLPFQCLSPLGNGTLFCAAKGTSIRTFDLSRDPQLLFSWSHPSAKQAGSENSIKQTHESVKNEEQTGTPPSKRRRVDSDAKSDAAAEDGQGTLDTPTNGNKSQKKIKVKAAPPKAEAPFVVLLAATEDGSHVIAVTGQDKTLWVFEHDGKGSLRELSQRYG
jgi:tRNA (guanine-N(7)-)-methyltransferase subunit TRM82